MQASHEKRNAKARGFSTLSDNCSALATQSAKSSSMAENSATPPLAKMSDGPGAGIAATRKPAAQASNSTSPNVSVFEGNTNKSAAA